MSYKFPLTFFSGSSILIPTCSALRPHRQIFSSCSSILLLSAALSFPILRFLDIYEEQENDADIGSMDLGALGQGYNRALVPFVTM